MLKLRYYGDPSVGRKTIPVATVDDGIRALAREMFEVMRAHAGVGLAANQTSERTRVIVIDVSAGKNPREAFALVNPRVTGSGGAFTDEEGCLSFPGLHLDIRRPLEIRVEALGLDGNPVTVNASGILARILMHEIDHLDGILFFRRLPLLKKLAFLRRLPALKRQYRKIAERTDVKGGEE